MKHSTSSKVFGILLLGLLILLSVSAEAMGQGRGRRASHMDKKCAKFVNCHDARDCRWDGRGPRRNVTLTSHIFRRHRRNRDRDTWDSRRDRRDRDFDHNRRWRRNR
jgi:hypothetical protein